MSGRTQTLPPYRDPREEMTRYRHWQIRAGIFTALGLTAVFVTARQEGDPQSASGRLLLWLVTVGVVWTVFRVFVFALMSHVDGAEEYLTRERPTPGSLFSYTGSIAADEAGAHPRLVALGGDIGARRRRRLRVRVDLRPGQMVISRARARKSDRGPATVTLAAGEVVTAEMVPLIYGSGLGVRMRDGTAFAVALPVSGSLLSRKLARWRAHPSSPLPGAEIAGS